MAEPTDYERGYSFTDYQADRPSKPLPGDELDNELDNIANALGETQAALRDVRRADGKLQNGIVGADALNATAVGALIDQSEALMEDVVFVTQMYLGQLPADPDEGRDGAALTEANWYYNTTSNSYRFWNGASWEPLSGTGTMQTYFYVATAGQTIIEGNDANGNAHNALPGAAVLSMNGAVLVYGRDYTIPTAGRIVLAAAAAADDEFTVITFTSLSMTDIGKIQVASYTGDGTTTTFNLPGSVVSATNVRLSIDGVHQHRGQYTVSGSTVTLNEAPPLGSAVEVEVYALLPLGSATASQIELDDGNDVQAWADARAVVPDDFGATPGTADSSAGLTSWLASPRIKSAASEYTISSQLVIPSGTRITGDLRLRRASGLTGTVLVIEDDVYIDGHLIFRDPWGTAVNPAITIGENFHATGVHVNAAAENTGTLVTMAAGFDIGEFRSTNFARPLYLGAASGARGVGGYLGDVEIDTFIRGISANLLDGWRIGNMRVHTRAAGASLTAGHNGLLVQGCSDWSVGTLAVEGSGEHALRIGGSADSAGSNDWTIGLLDAAGMGGCALKVNDGNAYAERFSVREVIGLGTYTGTAGRNRELLRLTRVRDGRIGKAVARKAGGADYSCFGPLAVDFIDGLRIDTIDCQDHAGEAFTIRADQDGSAAGDVENVSIGYMRAVGGSRLLDFSTTANVGEIRIADGYFEQGAELIDVNAAAVFTGPVELRGYAAAGRTITGLSAGQATVDLRLPDGMALVGDAVSSAQGTRTVTVEPVDPSNVSGAAMGGLTIQSQGGVSADGLIGGGINFDRPSDSTRRGAAIVAEQTGADEYSVGLSFFSGAGSTSTNLVTKQLRLTHNGDLEFLRAGRGPKLTSPDGLTTRTISIDNTGAIYTGIDALLVRDGSATAPGISWALDTNTGLFRAGADQIGFAAGGVQRARLSATALQLDVPLTGTAVTQSATDATAGRMLKVGDFGLGTETPPLCTDFNDTGMRNGWYRTEGNGATANTSGLPQEWGVLFVVRGTARITQIWYNDNTSSFVGTVFRRMWDGGSSSWTPWYRMLDGRSAVGAITRHSDGAATGPIIERGSNANGSYLRLADGSQICWHRLTGLNIATALGSGYESSVKPVWTFPAAFVAQPALSGASPTNNRTTVGLYCNNGTAAEVNLHKFTITTTSDQTADVVAIGRWF